MEEVIHFDCGWHRGTTSRAAASYCSWRGSILTSAVHVEFARFPCGFPCFAPVSFHIPKTCMLIN